jgi:hypothetical protein
VLFSKIEIPVISLFTAFFLVVSFDGERPGSREGAWLYYSKRFGAVKNT